MKYKLNNQWVDVNIKALDSMPVGTQVEYTGEDIPTGWEEVNDYSTTEVDTGKKWIDGKPVYRKVIEITDTNASTSNWKEYTYTTLGLPSTIELCKFPEAYAQITQANKLYTESFYSNGSRVQTAPADSKVNVLGNGVAYSKYIIIAEYTKTTD